MTSAALQQAEQRHFAAFLAAHPGQITLNNRTLPVGVIPRRGVRFETDGGLIQERMIELVVACALLPDAEIIDATTDATRPVRFTHVQTGRAYTLKTDASAPQKSPQGVFWTLTGAQTTAHA